MAWSARRCEHGELPLVRRAPPLARHERAEARGFVAWKTTHRLLYGGMPNQGIGPAALDHVAIAAHRIADAAELLAGRMGGAPHAGGPGVGFRGAQWEFAGGGRIEVIEPDGPANGFLHRFLAKHGPGFHHVTLKVSDIYRAADAARAFGYEVVGFNDQFEGWKEMFLHPRQAQGIVIQLAQTHPEIPDESWGPEFPFPKPPRTSDARVRVLGLRLAAGDLDKARRQWADCLGATIEREDDSLVFRWNDSPLWIRVVKRPHLPPGPLCLELDRRTVGDVSLFGQPDPRVGVRLEPVDAGG